MELLADEGSDYQVVRQLRVEGYSVLSILETSPGIMDEEVLAKAIDLDAVLLTEDKDFGELTYRLRLPNRGIVLLRMNGCPLEQKLARIRQLLTNYGSRLQSSFCVVTESKIRIVQQD